MKSIILIASLVMCGLVLSCQSVKESVDTTADVEAIRKTIYEPHSDLIEAGDIEGWLANYADDVVYMPSNGKTMRGKAAVRQQTQPIPSQYSLKESIEIERIKVSGDLAFCLFTYSFTAIPKAGGEATHDEGRLIHILERQDDGTWKITYHISSSDKPTEAPVWEKDK